MFEPERLDPRWRQAALRFRARLALFVDLDELDTRGAAPGDVEEAVVETEPDEGDSQPTAEEQDAEESGRSAIQVDSHPAPPPAPLPLPPADTSPASDEFRPSVRRLFDLSNREIAELAANAFVSGDFTKVKECIHELRDYRKSRLSRELLGFLEKKLRDRLG